MVTGDEADVSLGKENGEVVILSFEGRRHIVAVPSDPTKYRYDRARSERAWYQASDRILHVAPPVVLERDGREFPASADEIFFQVPR